MVYTSSHDRTIYQLTTMPRPVVNTPGCLTTQSPDLSMHFTFPQCAHVGSR